ncbi:MAG: hypothetical protein ABH875_01560 [Candidatus Omnitrophota bacterium]
MMTIIVWTGLTIFISGLIFTIISMFKLTETSRHLFAPGSGHLMAEAPRLESELKAVQDRLAASKTALNEEKESLAAMAAFLRGKEAEMSANAKAAKDAKAELAIHADNEARLEEMINSFKAELAAVNDSIPERVDEAKTPLIERIEALKEDAAKLEQEKATLKEENDSLRSDLTLINDEAALARREFDKSDEKRLIREALVKELFQNLDAVTSDIRNVKAENSDLAWEASLLKKELKNVVESGKTKDSIIEEIAQKRDATLKDCEIAREENLSLKARIAFLKEDLSTVRDSIPAKVDEAKIVLQKVIDVLKEDRAELLVQSGTYRAQNESFKAALHEAEERMRKRSAEFDALSESFSAATGDLAAARDSAASLSEQLKAIYEEKASLQSREQELNRVASSAQSERDLLKGELADAKADRGTLRAEMEEKDSTIDHLTKKVASLAEELMSLRRERDLFEEKVDSLRGDLGNVTESIPTRIKHAREDMQEELDTVKVDHLELNSQKEELEKQLRKYEHENVLLRQTLKGIKSEKSRLKKLLGDVA